jgi:hypothetical protein
LFLIFGLNERVSDEISFVSILTDSKEETYTILKDTVGKLGSHLMTYEESDFKDPSAAVGIAKDFLIKEVGGKEVFRAVKKYGSIIGFFSKFLRL